MGASYVQRVYAGSLTEAALCTAVQSDTERDGYESGHHYSGAWGSKRHGLTISRRVFDSVALAEQHISDTNDKWGPLFAVRARVLPDPLSVPARLETLKAEAHEAREALGRYPREVLAQLKAGPRRTRTCPTCGSRVAVAYLSWPVCPVCRHDAFGFTDANLKKIAALKTAVEQRQAAVAQAEADEVRALAANGTLAEVWVVGGWCSS